MAETTARPRPRPRPRPVQKASPKQKSPTAGLPSAAASSPGPSTSYRLGDAEIDDMFIKNKNRELTSWKKLDLTSRTDEAVHRHDDDGSNSDSDENLSPNSRKRRRAQKSNSLPRPKWQREDFKKSISNIPKADSGSDESDLEIIGEERSTPKAAKRRDAKRAKRSRSRSITPPPQLPLQQIENVRKVVWNAMGSKPSVTASQDDEDDGYTSSEPITLDPELERIARQAQREASSATPGFGPSYTNAASLHPEADEVIEVRVRWKPHPNAPNRDDDIEWQYQISRGDDFSELFEAIAEDAQMRVERLIVCYEGKRIFASVTPATLSLWRSADLDAYDKAAYEYIRANPELSYSSGLSATQPQTQVPPKSNGNPIELSDSDDEEIEIHPTPPPTRTASSYSSTPAYAQPSTTASSHVTSKAPLAATDSEAEDDDKFKLVIRSSASKDVTLTVRPSTKCGNIVKAFLKKAGLEAQYPHVFQEGGDTTQSTPRPKVKGRGKGKATAPPRTQKYPKLSVDGDKMDNGSPIGDADLEDGDQVEVVDL